MPFQELNNKEGNIEITLTEQVKGNFFSKLIFGSKLRKTNIFFDRLEKKIAITYSDGEIPYSINFSDVFQLIIHQHPDDINGFRVALILKTKPNYISLYSFFKPVFGIELFQELELMLIGKNNASKVYTFDAAKREFNL